MKSERQLSKFKYLVYIPNDDSLKSVKIDNFTIFKAPKQQLFLKVEKRIFDKIETDVENGILSPEEFKKHYVDKKTHISMEGYTDLLIMVYVKNNRKELVPIKNYGIENLEDFSFGIEYSINQ